MHNKCWVIRKSFLCFFQRCGNTSIHLGMKFLKLFVCILLKPMLRKSEQVRCSLYRRLYSISEQLVSLLAQDEYKQSETLQTLHGEHSTIEKNILKTFFTAVKRALTKTILWAYSYSIGPVFKWTLRRRNETHQAPRWLKHPMHVLVQHETGLRWLDRIFE